MHPDRSSRESVILGALLAIILAVTCFAVLGRAPLFDVDEGAFSEATREMLRSGNYLSTTLNGAPRFDKPILIYWLQLLSLKTFGPGEFAFRLPSALAAGAWSFALFLHESRRSGARQAFTAAAMLILSLQVTIIAKAAIADALLNLCLAGTLLSLLTYYRSGSRHALLLAFSAMGFGMLTKGPVAVLIPLAATFLFQLGRGTLRQWLRMVLDPAGIALFLAIALPWYLLEYRAEGMDFIQGFFLKHNVGRFGTSFEGHSGSILYYVPVVIIGLMPFTGLLYTVVRNFRRLMADPENLFLGIWTLFVFAFFSLSGTKLPHYMIYGYTPLFILMARALPYLRRPALTLIWPLLLLALLALLPALLPAAAAMAAGDPFIADILEAARAIFAEGHIILTLALAAAMAAIMLLRRFPAEFRLVASGLCFSLYVNLHVMALAGRLLQEPVKEAALLAKQNGWEIVMWRVDYPSFLVYSESLALKRDPRPGEVVLTTSKHLGELREPEVLYRKNGIVLLRTTQ
ncbi:glycosyltransferase family 39 protein [Chlorobium sp. N1]|uniref:ArnT family glycosyltransferase n=1 Tax=Chlorobium sp. N1 TaxID=2491138 RepID=UPI00103D717B|nr:glycosyltransferase family 39 protein [Chlorobium sp. N1]TCD47636.1 glycosyltransferase family 39 protein [Chlorobium sp. N1]